MTPELPDEFFSIAELQKSIGSPQRGRIIRWLKNNNVQHLIGLHGWPLVYRAQLLPHQPSEAQNDSPVYDIDFSGIYGTRRQTAYRKAS